MIQHELLAFAAFFQQYRLTNQDKRWGWRKAPHNNACSVFSTKLLHVNKQCHRENKCFYTEDMVASPVRRIFGILQQYPALQQSLLSKKSTCIASTALQNTLVSALLADVAIVLLMEVILCLHYILGHFLFTTKVRDLSLIIGYNWLRTPPVFLHTCQNLNLHDICSDANYHVLGFNESHTIMGCGINTRTMMLSCNANTGTNILSPLTLYKLINLHNCSITDCSFWPSIMPYVLQALVTFPRLWKISVLFTPPQQRNWITITHFTELETLASH